MIVTINGDHGSGKSTVAQKVAQDLGYKYYHTGSIFRSMAKEKGMTYAEFMKLMDKDPSIDREVDERTVVLGKKQDDFVFDSRLAWHFIPHSLKIFLAVDENEAAKRMLLHLKKEHSTERENEDKNLETLENVIASNKKRKAKDNERYKKLYDVDIWDQSNYDFVLDTTSLGIEQVHQKVLSMIKKRLAK